MLRHRSRYDWWLAQAHLPPMPRGWVIIDQAVHAPTLFNSSFTGGRYGARPLNGAEAQLALAVINNGLTPEDMPWYIRVEVPEWAAAELARSLGDQVEVEMEAMLHQAPLDLRANTLMIERDAAYRCPGRRRHYGSADQIFCPWHPCRRSSGAQHHPRV